jgi:hypothetical protein
MGANKINVNLLLSINIIDKRINIDTFKKDITKFLDKKCNIEGYNINEV